MALADIIITLTQAGYSVAFKPEPNNIIEVELKSDELRVSRRITYEYTDMTVLGRDNAIAHVLVTLYEKLAGSPLPNYPIGGALLQQPETAP